MSLIFEALKKGHAPAAEPSAPSAPQQALAPAAVTPVAQPSAAPAPSAPLSGLLLAVFAGMLLAGGGAWLYWAGKASNVSNPNSPSPVALAPAAATPAVLPAVVPTPAAAPAVMPAPVAAAVPVPAPVPAPAPAPVAVAVPAAVVAAAPVVAPTPATPKIVAAPVPVAPVVAPTPATPKLVAAPAAAKPLAAPAPVAPVAPVPAQAAAPAIAPVVRAPKVLAAAPAPVAASVALAAPAAPASKAVVATAPVAPPEPKPVPRAPVNTHVQVNIEPNPFDVRDVFQQFVQMLQAGKMPEAQAAADRISSAMGRSHVVSLRAQGYLALKKDDLALARSQYFLLHQLLPEDREAGLNLALIEWRQGDRESAAKRVALLLERFPNDQEIQALYLNVRNP